mgnify:CR=1 FL=1
MSKYVYLEVFHNNGCSQVSNPTSEKMFIRKEFIDYITPYKFESDEYNMCSFIHIATQRAWHCEIAPDELMFLLDKDDEQCVKYDPIAQGKKM